MKAGQKKQYVTPDLTIYGTLEKLTQQFGSDMTDVPMGTTNSGPGSVTGAFS